MTRRLFQVHLPSRQLDQRCLESGPLHSKLRVGHYVWLEKFFCGFGFGVWVLGVLEGNG